MFSAKSTKRIPQIKDVAKLLLEQDKILKTGLFRDVNSLKQQEGEINDVVLDAMKNHIKTLMTVKNPVMATKWKTLIDSVLN